jgi:tRNA-Thr(GGU) m(6)t(6)A37 methyltransferase TsaA
MTIEYKQIGTIYSPFENKEGMPIQAISANGIKGKIEINKDLEEGLYGLDGFSHILLIYSFHKSEGFDLKTKPFLSNKFFGVFATRAPKRPNAIGISVVKMLRINNNIIEIENVDVLNGTPLLDIKPYVPEFDIHKAEKIGWLENKVSEIAQKKSDTRFN